ncbi:5'/3'-nucleotidase SurE, partial [Frankia sp. AgKG'84/4]|uniref:5'/3'-nucleotidase SurE n=1 Tax=Frankia sp. AgKG'84/4 TaxID=573490 RepID=UPI00202A1C34
MSTRPVRLAVAVATVLLAAAACGSSGSADTAAPASASSTSASSAAPAPASATATRPADTTLDVLVTNDDGVSSAGIDAVARAIAALPNTTVKIVAPAANQSGTGGKTSGGEVSHNDDRTASGQPAVAVSGFPADAVNVALDALGLKPDLVVSGINEGQNLGPVVNLSGTVGAARAAAQRGIPALAASEGLGDTYDYAPGAAQVVAWITAHRAALL